MAINPNTTFTAGQVLTADQQNRFPRGIMQLVTSTSNLTVSGTEAVALTLPAFTAVANRIYKVTYFEPYVENSNANINLITRIKLTDISGTIIGRGEVFLTTVGSEAQITASYIGTLTAGSTVLVGTAQNTAASNSIFNGNASYLRMLWVEDLGPA
jgi:hypothetical protein